MPWPIYVLGDVHHHRARAVLGHSSEPLDHFIKDSALGFGHTVSRGNRYPGHSLLLYRAEKLESVPNEYRDLFMVDLNAAARRLRDKNPILIVDRNRNRPPE